MRSGPTLTHHHADLCRLPEPNPGSPLHPTGPHLVFCTSLLFIFPHPLSLGWCIYITISESNKLALMSKGRESIKAGSLIRGIGTVSQRHHKPKPLAKHVYSLWLELKFENLTADSCFHPEYILPGAQGVRWRGRGNVQVIWGCSLRAGHGFTTWTPLMS